MRRAACILAAALLGGCSAIDALVVDHVPVQVEQFHPALPAPVQPVDVEVKLLTPKVTEGLNDSVRSGDALPYVYFALEAQDWLTFAAWGRDMVRYVKALRAVVDYYRPALLHPGAEPPGEAPETAIPGG